VDDLIGVGFGDAQDLGNILCEIEAAVTHMVPPFFWIGAVLPENSSCPFCGVLQPLAGSYHCQLILAAWCFWTVIQFLRH